MSQSGRDGHQQVTAIKELCHTAIGYLVVAVISECAKPVWNEICLCDDEMVIGGAGTFDAVRGT